MTKQLTLAGNASMGNDNHSVFKNPAFVTNKSVPIHRWVPWIAGFSSDFVKNAFMKYLVGDECVLDPFAGVGTSLVEALLNNKDSVGFEINPYATFACKIKTSAYKIDVDLFETSITAFKKFYNNALLKRYTPSTEQPQNFKTREDFYSPQVLKKVLILQDFIENISNDLLKDFFKLAFAATMIKYSNYSYEPSLGRRKSSGKKEIHDFPVDKVIVDKLNEMLNDVLWVKKQLGDFSRIANVKIYNDSFFNYKHYITAGTIDFLITSPPYLNNYHYNRNTRPQLYWLGLVQSSKEFKPIELENFGKYWQTVRGEKRICLINSLPETDLEECLELIREKKPEKGIYGGNGWANYAASYFNDCFKFAEGIMYCLKSGNTALIVVGNSILQGVQVPTDYYFAKISEKIGLELVNIHIPRQTRVGSSIINSAVRVGKAPDKRGLYEAVVELKKP